MPLIRVESLHKTYRLGRVPVPVLRGVSMQVESGEFVAILGASGSGKSTLLHLIGGLDRPDRSPRAVIEFDGRDLAGFSIGQLDAFRHTSVGFVFQFYHLLPELDVMQNVLIAAMVRHGRMGYMKRGSVLRARAGQLLEAFGLGHRLGHRPRELSGGERQRVAIARALINEPRAILADEPTGNLDQVTGKSILDTLTELNRREGRTLVVVTHDSHTAARAARVVRLEDGRIVNGECSPGRPSAARV